MNKLIIALLLIFVLLSNIGIAIAFDQTWSDNDCNGNCDNDCNGNCDNDCNGNCDNDCNGNCDNDCNGNWDNSQCSVPTKIILVRHGQTSWNLLGILQGNADVPLDSTGVIEAQELVASTSGKTVDAVYSSPLSRAYDTAQSIAAEHQLSVEEEDDLREIGLGIYTGYKGSQIPSEIRTSWTTNPNFAMPSGVPDSTNLLDPSYVYGIYFEGESLNMVADRTWDEITDIADEHCGENVVTVTHGGVIKITLTQVYGLDVEEYNTFLVPTGSQTVLEFQPDSSVVVLDDW